MSRTTIRWSQPPIAIRIRNSDSPTIPEIQSKADEATPGNAPSQRETSQESERVIQLLESLHGEIRELERRRQQSLSELQHVAVELAVAAASHLVGEAIDRSEFAVENLVRQAVETIGRDQRAVISLHPQDLDLLETHLTGKPVPWSESHIVMRSDSTISRGGCRAEAPDGRVLVSDIASRLSEIRRHWMEELDDAQIERRKTRSDSQELRHFPERRETA